MKHIIKILAVVACASTIVLSIFSFSNYNQFKNNGYGSQVKNIHPPRSGYWVPDCKCKKHKGLNGTSKSFKWMERDDSTCSEEANYVGVGQKVVAFSLFFKSAKDIKEFAQGLEPNLKKVKELYPGWYMRLYTNANVTNTELHFCDLTCKNDQLIWCDITKIPKLGDLSRMNGRMWRFLPFGDPTVETFISRDLDSVISTRERDAVGEWEESDKIFHMMRDVDKAHDTAMLAGMLGVKNYRLTPSVASDLQNQTIKFGLSNRTWKGQDQLALRKMIYNTSLVAEIMGHDSYMCEKYPGSVPFPTQRVGHIHVGDHLRKRKDNFSRPLATCPLPCRPSYGQDWKYC